jgi:hypothetical protein
VKLAVAEAMTTLTLARGSGDGGRAAAWANVPEVFITFAVSFTFLELKTSRIDVDGGEVFDGVAARALHPDLRWDLGAERDVDLERGSDVVRLSRGRVFPHLLVCTGHCIEHLGVIPVEVARIVYNADNEMGVMTSTVSLIETALPPLLMGISRKMLFGCRWTTT